MGLGVYAYFHMHIKFFIIRFSISTTVQNTIEISILSDIFLFLFIYSHSQQKYATTNYKSSYNPEETPEIP